MGSGVGSRADRTGVSEAGLTAPGQEGVGRHPTAVGQEVGLWRGRSIAPVATSWKTLSLECATRSRKNGLPSLRLRVPVLGSLAMTELMTCVCSVRERGKESLNSAGSTDQSDQNFCALMRSRNCLSACSD